jgi:hypothetical protein
METTAHAQGRPENGDVRSSINYMIAMAQKPARYLCTPPPGAPEFNWQLESQSVQVYDGRPRLSLLSIEKQGFTLRRAETAVTNFYDQEQVLHTYYPEVERLVREVTDARTVLAFDYNVRSGSKDERCKTGAFPPARFVHADYTPRSAPQRVRDLLPAQAAEESVKRRYAFVNVWRPIKGPVQNEALALLDAQSVAAKDLVATDLLYTDRTGEIYNVTFNPAHRWYYFRHMEASEVMVFANFDSLNNKIVPHSAFDDPTASSDASPRESIEVRTIAFF